jgi:hypothetical protein
MALTGIETQNVDVDVEGYDPENLPNPHVVLTMRAATAKSQYGRHGIRIAASRLVSKP